jgi:hypothetical protein
MFSTQDIITGEKIQELCEAYCGLEGDFKWNPRISTQTTKHIYLDKLNESWNNPKLLFCYSHCIDLFVSKLPYIQNRFILVSHNSDQNITSRYQVLIDSPLLVKWYAQNLCVDASTTQMIPIGIANSMWAHGNLSMYPTLNTTVKLNMFYFNFNINTNMSERSLCKNQIERKGLPFMKDMLPYTSYLKTLSTYKYAICPPGNGIDSHRIWECYYCNVIPIVIATPWSHLLKKSMPCIVLTSWNEFDADACLQQYPTLFQELQDKRDTLLFTTLRNTLLSAVMMI